MRIARIFALGILTLPRSLQDNDFVLIKVESDFNFMHNVSCLYEYTESPSCKPMACARSVVDGLFSSEDISNLLSIVKKGMSQRLDLGGPTILDINTGYIRDSAGIENLFLKENLIYNESDFHNYASIINRLKSYLENIFGISDLYFTAPTFM